MIVFVLLASTCPACPSIASLQRLTTTPVLHFEDANPPPPLSPYLSLCFSLCVVPLPSPSSPNRNNPVPSFNHISLLPGEAPGNPYLLPTTSPSLQDLKLLSAVIIFWRRGNNCPSRHLLRRNPRLQNNSRLGKELPSPVQRSVPGDRDERRGATFGIVEIMAFYLLVCDNGGQGR